MAKRKPKGDDQVARARRSRPEPDYDTPLSELIARFHASTAAAQLAPREPEPPAQPVSRFHEIVESRQAPGVVVSDKSIRPITQSPRSAFEEKLQGMVSDGFDISEGKHFRTTQDRVEHFAQQERVLPARMSKNEFDFESSSKQQEKAKADAERHTSMVDNAIDAALNQTDRVRDMNGTEYTAEDIRRRLNEGQKVSTADLVRMNESMGGGSFSRDGFKVTPDG